ncbi:hypothetical protein [Herbaspirillum autotrophicum]|uniref:hypothetical protein n=1 Tax=Herbaspirillum autotrophicum TaxID=180195 RepID=UPI0012ECC69C|nr:hypothetical protein [Herbaspirillum autotrophicum]
MTKIPTNGVNGFVGNILYETLTPSGDEFCSGCAASSAQPAILQWWFEYRNPMGKSVAQI